MRPVPIVGIDPGDERAARESERLVDGRDVAAIAIVADDAQARVGVHLEHLRRLVGRPVVNDDHLERRRVGLVEDARQAVAQEPRVVVAGDDDAEKRCRGHRCLITRAGTPTAVTLGGRSRTTAAPAPTIVHSPTETLSMTVAPAPM